MEDQEHFFRTECTQSPHPSLLYLSSEEIRQKLEKTEKSEKWTLHFLLNGMLGASLPTDNEEESLACDPNFYIRENLKLCIAKVYLAFNRKERPPVVTALGNAIWSLFRETDRHPFEQAKPGKKEAFDFQKHDLALNAFRAQLSGQLESISKLENIDVSLRQLSCTIVICFARSLFELRGFQAPPRLTQEEALRDAMGESDLWAEYLAHWQLTHYLETQ